MYVSIDLHRRTSRIVTLDEAGAVICQRIVGSERASVEDALSRIERPAEAVFEASGGGAGHGRIGVTSTSPVGKQLELDRPEPRDRVLGGYFDRLVLIYAVKDIEP